MSKIKWRPDRGVVGLRGAETRRGIYITAKIGTVNFVEAYRQWQRMAHANADLALNANSSVTDTLWVFAPGISVSTIQHVSVSLKPLLSITFLSPWCSTSCDPVMYPTFDCDDRGL